MHFYPMIASFARPLAFSPDVVQLRWLPWPAELKQNLTAFPGEKPRKLSDARRAQPAPTIELSSLALALEVCAWLVAWRVKGVLRPPFLMFITCFLFGISSSFLHYSKFPQCLSSFDVTLIEKNETAGGRMRSESINTRFGEFRFDSGPSLLLFPEKYREARCIARHCAQPNRNACCAPSGIREHGGVP